MTYCMMTDCDVVEKLVGLVKERPILYDFNLEDHHKSDIVDMAWEEVAILMNVNVHECKARWQSLRNSYIKCLREEKKYAGRNSCERKRKKVYLAELLGFLSDTCMGQEVEIKIKTEDDESIPNDVAQVLTPKKSTTKELPISQCACDDADLCFFKSLVPDLKKLRYVQKRRFKERTLKCLNQLLEMQEMSVKSTVSQCLPSTIKVERPS